MRTMHPVLVSHGATPPQGTGTPTPVSQALMTPIAPQGHDSSPPKGPTLCMSQGKPHHSPRASIQPGLFQGAGLPQAPEHVPSWDAHTWYCWGTEGRGCWGAAESAALEDGAGGRETGCFGWRGPGAEPPPTESRGWTTEDGQWSPMRSG